MTQLFDRIEPANPKYIILKFFFTSPKENDSTLINCLQKYDNILTQAACISEPSEFSTKPIKQFNIGKNEFKFPNYTNAWIPYPELARCFEGIGFVNVLIDGGDFKEFQIVNSLENILYPSLPLLILQKEIGEDIKIRGNEILIGSVTIPLNNRGSFKINLSEPSKFYPTYSFTDIIKNAVNLDIFNNNIVIIFMNTEMAPQLKSVYKRNHNAAEIVADAINTVLKFE